MSICIKNTRINIFSEYINYFEIYECINMYAYNFSFKLVYKHIDLGFTTKNLNGMFLRYPKGGYSIANGPKIHKIHKIDILTVLYLSPHNCYAKLRSLIMLNCIQVFHSPDSIMFDASICKNAFTRRKKDLTNETIWNL